MAGDVHAGDLVLIPLRKGHHLVQRGVLLHREGGVDIHLVGGGDGIQHLLQRVQIRQRLAAGKDEIAPGRDGVQRANGCNDLLQRETRTIGIFLFIDTEGAVVLTIVGHEHRYGSAALPGLIRIHVSCKTFPCEYSFNIVYRRRRKCKEKSRKRRFCTIWQTCFSQYQTAFSHWPVSVWPSHPKISP